MDTMQAVGSCDQLLSQWLHSDCKLPRDAHTVSGVGGLEVQWSIQRYSGVGPPYPLHGRVSTPSTIRWGVDDAPALGGRLNYPAKPVGTENVKRTRVPDQLDQRLCLGSDRIWVWSLADGSHTQNWW